MSTQEFDGVSLEDAPEGSIPKCPYCKEKLAKIWIKKKGLGVMEQKQMLMCPYCESLLGYGVFGQR